MRKESDEPKAIAQIAGHAADVPLSGAPAAGEMEIAVHYQLFRHLPKGPAHREHGVADQAGILHRRLAVVHSLAIDGCANHPDKARHARIFGDETMIPTLARGPDQHQLEPALPNDPAAEP